MKTAVVHPSFPGPSQPADCWKVTRDEKLIGYIERRWRNLSGTWHLGFAACRMDGTELEFCLIWGDAVKYADYLDRR